MTGADPINPMRIFHELSSRLPANAIVASDSGSAANWYARHLKFHGEMRGSLSGTLATMGPGVPYVIGAKWAHPDRPAIALVGDGAMQMNGMAELITVAHYWQQWADPRLIVAVLHNNDLNQVTWEMRAMENSPKFAASQTLPDVDYAGFARSLGLAAENIDDPEQLGGAWDRALAADRPTVLDIRCDPDVPPIPPHATFEQAKSVAQAVLHGDEDARGFIKQGVKQKVQQYLPGRKDDRDHGCCVARRRLHRCPHRPVRTLPVGADGGRGRDHRRRDLPVPRRGQLRQQDDVVAGRRRADRHPGRNRRRCSRAAPRRPCLPLASAAIVVNGLQGTYLHWRGIRQRPGGWTRYNLESGPPAFAPLLASLVGGMGLLAAVLRREPARRPTNGD